MTIIIIISEHNKAVLHYQSSCNRALAEFCKQHHHPTRQQPQQPGETHVDGGSPSSHQEVGQEEVVVCLIGIAFLVVVVPRIG